MTQSRDHLDSAARDALDQPQEERIEYIRTKRYAPYAAGDLALAALSQQATLPRGYSRPNLLVYGAPRHGKTTIAERHHQRAARRFDPRTGRKALISLYILMPPVCNAKWFYSRILKALNAPPRAGGAMTHRIGDCVIDLCRATGVRQILIDEAHNLLNGNVRQQHELLAIIRDFGNSVEIPLALFGTQDAREALSLDRQLDGRFRKIELPSWTPDTEFETLVGTLVRTLPLEKPSAFTKQGLRLLAATTGGVTAYIVETLMDLAVAAVQSGDEQITPEALLAYLQTAEFKECAPA